MVENSRRLSRPVKILITALAVVLAFSMLIPRTRDFFALYMQKQELQTQIVALQQRQEQLEKEKTAMNDPETIEREAREQLGMIKEGEKVMVKVESP